MQLLEITQIIFNLVISLAVIVLAVFVSLIAYETIKFIKAFKKLMADINKESSELYEKLNKFLESVFSLSFVSRFFKKKSKK